MKRIALIDFDMSVVGGVEQVTAALASALADFAEVHLISLCLADGSPAYPLDPRLTFVSLSEKPDRLRLMRKKLRPMLADYLRSHRIDAAIIQGNYPGFIASAVRFSCRTKLIFCDHGALMNQWGQKDIVLMRWIASRLCHMTVTLTRQSRDDYIHRFHLPNRRVTFIYNWIDLDIPRSDVFDASSHRIVSAGRFGKEKGFDLLVKAFAPVAQTHPDWHLDLFGDGEMMPEVRRLVDVYGLADNVHLLGMRKDLAQRYRDYAMYVLPSHREGMPLVLLEAKANRLPIVSFDVMTGPREIVRDGIDGLLVPPEDVEALGRAMCRVIEDDALRQSMSDRSQENLDRFSKETILQQWLALLENKL